MRKKLASVGFLGLSLWVVRPVSADPPPTPPPTPVSAPQHVTVPSLPGQPNREGTVKPEGGMPMDSEGYAVTKRLSTDTTPTAPPAKAGEKAPPPSQPGAGPAPAAVPAIPVGPAPTGKGTVTGANYINVRAVLESIEAGKSLTVTIQKTGAEVTYTLAPEAKVAADLKPGDPVRVRVQAVGKGKVADRVEKLEKK